MSVERPESNYTFYEEFIMKFKREDIGVYVTLGLLGAGIGLLIGTVIESLQTDELIEVNRNVSSKKESEEAVKTSTESRRTSGVQATTEVTRQTSKPENRSRRTGKDWFKTEETVVGPSGVGSVEGGAEEGSESGTGASEPSDDEREDGDSGIASELDALDMEYGVSSMQRAMVEAGVLTTATLGRTLEAEREKTSYTDYHSLFDTDKPDSILDVEAEEVPLSAQDGVVEVDDSGFEIYITRRVDAGVRKNVDLVYYRQEGRWMRKTGTTGRTVPVDDIIRVIGEESIDRVDRLFSIDDQTPLFVFNPIFKTQYRVVCSDDLLPFKEVSDETI